MIWIVLVVFVIAVLIALAVSADNGKKLQQERSDQDEFMRQNGITKSVDYKWQNTMNSHSYRFIADEKAHIIYIGCGVKGSKLEEIPYEKIIGFEILEDSQIVGGIKRAIVGGALAGGAGAIVGAQTANKKAVSSLKAVIYREDVTNPQYTFYFISSKTKVTDSDYTSAKRFAGDINAVIKAIVSKMDHDTKECEPIEAIPVQVSMDDIAEKLRKLKSLYEDGLISTEEYEEKKKDYLKDF